jgi:hypothetical protein
VAAERATNLANRQLASIPLCSEEIRCHERILSDRALTLLRSLDPWSLVVGNEEARLSNLQKPLLGVPFDRNTSLSLQTLGGEADALPPCTDAFHDCWSELQRPALQSPSDRAEPAQSGLFR